MRRRQGRHVEVGAFDLVRNVDTFDHERLLHTSPAGSGSGNGCASRQGIDPRDQPVVNDHVLC